MAEFRQQTEAQAFTVVDFFAEWCGPCKAIAPQVDQMAALHPHITFLKVFFVGVVWIWHTPTNAYDTQGKRLRGGRCVGRALCAAGVPPAIVVGWSFFFALVERGEPRCG